MQNAIAFADNDVVTIAWSYGRKPEGCMGFAVYRIDSQNNETPLPSHAVFKGDTIKNGQTTAQFPIQKFYWKDPFARLVAEKTGNRKFRYKIVPLAGLPHHLKPMGSLPLVISNEIEVSPAISAEISAYFNRGLISTQHVSKAMAGKPNAKGLIAMVSDAANPLRADLAGDMVRALTGFVDRAATSGKIYAALYELHDEQLLQKLEGLGMRLQVVLSNSAVTDPVTKQVTDANAPARARLQVTASVEWNRIMPPSHIGHNKFLVHVDSKGKPRAVLLGSTNWTPTGLCTQTNNTLVIENAQLAARYLAYWKQLAADTKAANGVAKALQGSKLRSWDGTSKTVALDAGTSLESWFSPNTPAARKSGIKNEARPVDMAALVKRINAAQHSILFLAFYPGAPCIANWAADALRANRNLFVRGCVTNQSASEGFYYQLKGMTPPKKKAGAAVRQDPRVFAAEALDGKVIPKGWMKELLNAGFAIIHDKIMVIDPFSDDCVVVTGSHNLGHKASYDNDENLVIIEGNRKLAAAYATHVLDVYDHFSWRYMVNTQGAKAADQSLSSTPDAWQEKYFDAAGQIKTAQLKFWMSAVP